ncbi:MAG: acyl-CoA dehydrogenase family protein [Verrucomicrobiota bacterium]
MIALEEKSTLGKPSLKQWLDKTHELGRAFESRSEAHDASGSFAVENCAALKEHGFFGAQVPATFGGGGVSHSEMCDIVRTLAQYCSSTALAHSMHQHLVSTAIWKFNHGQGGEPTLRNVAARQLVLVGTGAGDWLDSNGEAVRVEGGYRVTAEKRFASQSVAGDMLVTSAPFRDPESGWQVLHFPVPMKSEGVTVLDDWHTLGMRSSGSNSIRLQAVFVPDSNVNLRRPRGVYHPVFNVVLTAALPLVMSAYIGIAQKAARIALDIARARPRHKPHLATAIGAMMNDLTSAELHLADMIRLADDLDFLPENRLGQDILARKTNTANACVSVVTRAMEIAGGTGFYRGAGLEKLFRDVQAAKYHALPQPDQEQFLGESLLKSAPAAG